MVASQVQGSPRANGHQTPAQADGSAQASPAQASPPAGPAAAPEAAAPKKRGKGGIVFLVVLLVGAIGGGSYWYSRRNLESTDNAQVDGEVVAVPSRGSGIVTKVYIVENQRISAGDPIADLDDTEVRARLKQAEARVAVAEAQADAADATARIAATNAKGNSAVAKAALNTAAVGAMSAGDQIKEAQAAVKSAETQQRQAQLDADRDKSLFDSHAIAQFELDRSNTALDLASSNLDAAKARLATLQVSSAQAQSRVVEATAKADQSSDVDAVVAEALARARSARADLETAKTAVEIAKIDLSYMKILAPRDGYIAKKTIAEGQAVGAGQPVADIVVDDVWISANFKETQVGEMKVGDKADIEVDTFDGVKLHGEVESFSAATGARFALLPPDNASGNFTKVVQRLPLRVKIDKIPDGIVLRPGMSVELTVHVR